MKSLIVGLSAPVAFALSLAVVPACACPALLNHTVEPMMGGAPQSLCQYEGRVVLVVNTASECGYTGQYEGLQALHKKYAAKGLVVLGFPSNGFGRQEPGSNKSIAEFCQANFGVTFPVFAKIDTVPLKNHPIFAGLTRSSGFEPKWNFHKYLIDRKGARVESFESSIEPQSMDLMQKIESLLAQAR
jgi:glutathione peroxidase